MNVPTHCPNCHEASWRYLGLGTQKLEEFVQIKFPDARILRMDADTTTRKHAHENLLKSFDEGYADILLGDTDDCERIGYRKSYTGRYC